MMLAEPDDLIKAVKEGRCDPLSAYVDLKLIERHVKSSIDALQPYAVNEADKYPGKSFEAFGATIEKRSAPATWDYSTCLAHVQAKNRLKYIEKIAQAGGGADVESGEIIDRAFKVEGKETIAIKF